MIDVRLAGRYRLESEIGAGGMTGVWQAVDEVLERPVAVKILHRHLLSNQVFCDRFRKEALAAGALIHPNIVSVYDTGQHDEAPYVVMEYVAGGSLARRLVHGPLPSGEVAAIGADVCEALGYAHRVGVVHRDLKPDNILVSESGQVKVTDFAVAGAALGGDLTATGALLGTLSFLAPEVLEGGEPDPAADLYALGVVLFKALTGRSPRVAGMDLGTSAGKPRPQPAHPRDFRPEVPRDLDAAVARALSANPAERFADAAEFGRVLRSVAQARPARTAVSSAPAPPPPRTHLPAPAPPTPGDSISFVRSEGRWLAPVVLLVLVAIAVVIGVLQLSGKVTIIGGGGGSTAAPAANPTVSQVALHPGGTLKPNPPAGDPYEHQDQVALAFDGNPSTSWSTQWYPTPVFGGLRDGVGIYGDAGQPVALKRIEVDTALPGWTAAIKTSDDGQTWSAPGPSATVDAQHNFDVSALGSHRYWMVWITNLVSGPNGYQASIAEIKAFH
ncbi:MAG: eukaryotic-like serine/threonine-protein kinase [Actinomycetota bacterium]|jgi:serine/threonine-protein kinase|nr:eukaryotic-like serine/threonine-protein kinase [Actinomycetota bacterium]